MARVFDPISKQWIDDGLPENPVTGDAPLPGVELPADGVPAMPSVGPEDVQQGPLGAAGQAAATAPLGTAENPMVAAIAHPPKPESETQVSRQQMVKGKDTIAADAALTDARAKVDAAQPALTEIESQEDNLTALTAEQTAQAKAAELERKRLAEEARQKDVAERRRQDEEMIAAEKKKRVAAGNGEQSYWQGRPAAEIFTRILQAVGGALHSAAGKSGEDPVTRTLNSYKAAHEKRLMAEHEAEREANKAKREGFERDEAEETRREIAAANQSIASIDLLGEQLKSSIASLSPEKRKAAQALADAKLAESRAEEERKAAAAYDKLTKIEETRRSMGGGGAGPEKLTERQQVGATGIEGALQAVRGAAKTKDFSIKERELVEQYLGEARQIKESSPEAFRAALNKLGGNYYTQFSENGRERFNQIQQAAQDLERVLSGGVINPHEFASRMSMASKPGGLTAITERAHAMAAGLPTQTREYYRGEISKVAQELSEKAPRDITKVPSAKLREGLIRVGKLNTPKAQQAAAEIQAELDRRKGAK